MIKFINAITGGEMWVADDRAGEYIAAGHRPAALPEARKPAAVEKMAELTEDTKKADSEPEVKKPTVRKPSRKAKK